MTQIKHLGLIVDGNRRWATRQGLITHEGHNKTFRVVLPTIIKAAFNLGIEELSVWLFSTENWKRSTEEIDNLMHLYEELIDYVSSLCNELDVRVNHFGRKNRLPKELVRKLSDIEQKVQNSNASHNLNLCLDYGGQEELLRAVKLVVKSGISESEITVDSFSQYLDTKESLPLDLIIRTGGETRLSGFMPWQSVYSELYFEPLCFPDFTEERLKAILHKVSARHRRFGGN